MAEGQVFTRFMWGGETTYGTAATRDNVLSRVQSFEPQENNSTIYERGLGEGLNIVQSYYGPYLCGATNMFNVNSFEFLKHFIGGRTGAGTAGDPYKFNEATSIGESDADLVMQPFTFEAANTTEATDDVQLFTGCIGNEFTLQATIGEIISCNATFFAQKSTRDVTATSYTPSTAKSYLAINGTWKFGATPTEFTSVRAFTINYTNNLDPNNFRTLDNRFIYLPVLSAGRLYTGSLTVYMSQSLATTIYTNFYGQTPTSGPVSGSTDPAVTPDLEFKIELINGTSNASIWLDQCSIDSISSPIAIGGGVVELTFNFTAKYGKDNAPIKYWTA